MTAIQDDMKSYEAATQLRATIAELFGAQPSERMILAPGILTGLHALFANFGIKRLAITNKEYYGPEHFPSSIVETLSINNLVNEVEAKRPDALLASVVSWRGRSLSIPKAFCQIKESMGAKAPILIADYSHAGASGFPLVCELGADIVSGDPAKWVLTQSSTSRFAFFWFRNNALFDAARRVFAPFFLATPTKECQFFARWLDAQDVYTIVSDLYRKKLNRDILLQRHRVNLSLALELAAELKLRRPHETSIIWAPKELPSEVLPVWMIESGLVWNPPTGGTRILCRAEVKLTSLPFALAFAI